jgi:hypothetical protein
VVNRTQAVSGISGGEVVGNKKKYYDEGLGHGSVVKYLPSMCETKGPSPALEEKGGSDEKE